MTKQIHLCVLFFLVLLLQLHSVSVFAEEQNAEVEINLDDLEEEGTDEAGDGEALLPVSGTIIEVEKHSALMALALVVLVPAAALLFRPKRVRRRKGSPVNQQSLS